MKKLITNSAGQLFGPFSTIRELSDRYNADGVDYPKDDWKLVERDLPKDFSIGDYIDNGSEVVKLPPPVIPEIVPEGVTMRQARLALLAIGKLKDVNQAIAAMPGLEGEAARIEWDYSSAVYRSKPLVISLGKLFGWGDAELDALFIQANKL